MPSAVFENARVFGRPDDEPSPRLAPDLAARLFAVLLGTLLLIVIRTFPDYGMTWDENTQSRYGETLLRFYRTLGRDDTAAHFGNLYLYGGFFETLAEGIASFWPNARFEARHLVGALFGLLVFPAVYSAGRMFQGSLGGLFAAILLGLNPLFYGHLFANSKDSPFAASFMVALYFILDSVRDLRTREGPRPLRIGLAIGVSAGIRVWGLALLGWLILLWGAALFFAPRPLGVEFRDQCRRAVRSFAAIAAIAWALMLLAWPWAIHSPVVGPVRALLATATLRPDVSFLFRGEIVSAAALPRDYAFTWFLITLPEVHLVGLALGLIAAAMGLGVRGRAAASLREGQTLPLIWLSVVTLSPLILVAVARPFLYDSVRHLLFVIPPLCVLSGAALAAVLRGALASWVAWVSGLACLGSCLLTAMDMVELHPYQTVYFNRSFGGGLSLAASRFETDYWGSTYKEGVEWLTRDYRPDTSDPIRLALLGDPSQLTYYLDRADNGGRFQVRDPEIDPHVLLIPRNRNRYLRIQGTLLHTINRQGTPLLFIFEIRKPEAKEHAPSGELNEPHRGRALVRPSP